jgi:hypothetical protein
LLICVAAVGTVHAQVLFFDDFNGPTLASMYSARRYNAYPNGTGDLPNDVCYRYGFSDVNANYLGPATYAFEVLNGAAVLRTHGDFVNANARWGWRALQTFSSSAPLRLEARVNTVGQPSIAYDTGSELFELWIFDPADPYRYDKVTLLMSSTIRRPPGAERGFNANSSVTNAVLDTPFAFSDNTWYRFVMTGSPTQEVRAAIYADDGVTELIGFNLGHTLAAFPSGFNIGFSQSDGPGGSYVPTDAAIDWIRLTAIDTTPPVISGLPPAGCTLWPPNHKLIQVATVAATDTDSGLAPGSFGVTGTSNEPSDPKNPDVVITPNGSGGFNVQLRADRLASGSGRIYTLTATAKDLNGNIASKQATCAVPHDQGQ